MKLLSYLIFNAQAEEAGAFYAHVLGGKVEQLCRYSDCEPAVPEIHQQYIMHSQVVFEGNVIMMADAEPGGKPDFGNRGCSLILNCDSIPQIESIYAQLTQEGSVRVALGEAFFAKRYAEFNDRFGVSWMLILE